ncbi:PDR/VanB family oxidoreductase [Marinobacter nauticus]|uniref:Uncharacterized protein n=1 Tax=Marinobacter nauticus TaxID=2743 RepID=A0A1M2URV6_MARNT|nr:PDR/VanB family oxidoreductase [Marinobacter nauticus]OJS98055.1 hypothetical protein BEE62_17265 [Marinobacter nauticus]
MTTNNEWLTVNVDELWQESAGVKAMYLSPADGSRLPEFTPGSHIDVKLGEKLIRQYSLINSVDDLNRYQIAVLKEVESRGGSLFVHNSLRQGDTIQISHPRNHFHLMESDKKAVLFAGGIGVTPILSMAQSLAASGKPFELHYFAKSESTCAFRGAIRESSFADQTTFYFDDRPEDQDKAAIMHSILSRIETNSPVYVCGPGGFIDFVITNFSGAGWQDSAIHREYFVAPELQESGDSKAFKVQVNSTGETYTVGENETIVEVLEANGIEIPVSCEQGICGTCITRVLEGEPEHHDMFMTDDEHAKNDQITACCSRSKSDVLVLDL